MRSHNRHIIFYYIGVISVICLSFIPRLDAQELDATARYRLAQSFEQAGQWEKAATIYESLYETDRQNYLYFDGLRRSYTQLKEYDRAIELVSERLRLQSNDVNLLAILGGLYYKAGREKKADSLWQVVVKTDPNNVNLYRLVASQLIEHRLYDQAIKTYLAARAATGNQTLFNDELASLYGALQQYEAATREFVIILQTRPQQLAYVQSRMASYVSREEGRSAALGVARESVRKWPNEVALRSLFAWLQMEGKDFEAARAEYRIIDLLTKANGVEIFNFAQLAFREHAYGAAAKAYREVLERYPSEMMLPQARFGFARCIEELTIESDTLDTKSPASLVPQRRSELPAEPVSESYPTYQGAIALYEGIIPEYPNTLYAAESLFRVGVIKYQRFFDLDGALGGFRQVRMMGAAGNLRFDATARIAEILLAQNNLAGSRGEWNALRYGGPIGRRDESVFRLAELDYFEAAFDSALVKLRLISANVGTDLTNDALDLQYFIEENKNATSTVLSEFARADLLMRQRKYGEALSRFTDLSSRAGGLFLEDDVLMRIAELHLLLHQVAPALASFQHLLTKLPNSILRDRAQMRIGEVYETILKDKGRATEAYEQLLIKFPTSLYVEEARKRIRLLRGDAL